MATAKIEYEAEVAKTVQAIEKVIQKQVKLRSSGKGVTDEAKKGESAFRKFGSSAAGDLGRMAAGILTVGTAVAGLKKGWDTILAVMQKINDAQKSLGAQSMTMDTAARRVGQQAGQDTAWGEKKIREMVLAGGLPTVGTAQNLAFASLSAWQEKLGLTKEREMGLTVARFAGRRLLDEQAALDLVEVLAKLGVETPGEAKRVSEMVYAGASKTQTNVSEFVSGVARMSASMSAAGATPAEIMATMVTGRGMEYTTRTAAEVGEQITVALGKAPVIKAMGQYRGTTGDAWDEQGFGAKWRQFGEFIVEKGETPAGRAALREVLPGEQLQKAKTFFSAFDLWQKNAEEFRGMTAGIFDIEEAKYADAPYRKRTMARSKAMLAGITASQRLKAGEDLLIEARGYVSPILAGEDVDIFSAAQERSLRGQVAIRGMEKSARAVAIEMLSMQVDPMVAELQRRGEISVISSAGGPMGGGPGSDIYAGETPLGVEVAKIHKMTEDLRSGLILPGSQGAAFGEVLMRLTRAIEEFNANNTGGGAPFNLDK